MEPERSPAASFGRAWFVLTVAFALHVFDEATTGFLAVYNPHSDCHARALGMVSHADV
jgi:hypothetical protein